MLVLRFFLIVESNDDMAMDATIGSLHEISVEFQGTAYPFFVSGEQTVLDLKIMIEERVSIPSGEQKLEFSGQMTYGDRIILHDCGIEHGSCVELTIKGKGGAQTRDADEASLTSDHTDDPQRSAREVGVRAGLTDVDGELLGSNTHPETGEQTHLLGQGTTTGQGDSIVAAQGSDQAVRRQLFSQSTAMETEAQQYE